MRTKSDTILFPLRGRKPVTVILFNKFKATQSYSPYGDGNDRQAVWDAKLSGTQSYSPYGDGNPTEHFGPIFFIGTQSYSPYGDGNVITPPVGQKRQDTILFPLRGRKQVFAAPFVFFGPTQSYSPYGDGN